MKRRHHITNAGVGIGRTIPFAKGALSLYVFHVATAIFTVEQLSAILGVLPSTLDREIRALRLAAMLPTGQRGGGKGSAHFNEYHYASIMLGLAGPLPSDAPDAVRALRSLPFRRQHPAPENVGEPLPTLEDMLANWIKSAGAARRADARWLPEDEAKLRAWKMQLCLDPRHAIVWTLTAVGESTIVYAEDPKDKPPGVTRLTVISGDVLLAVGELLADTEKQLAASKPSLLDQVRANASLEGKSAGHPCQRVPALSRDQPHANGTGIVLTDVPECARRKKDFQGQSLSWVGHHSMNELESTPS